MTSRSLTNWSGNRTVKVKSYYEPTSVEEVKNIFQECQGRKIRFIGSNMSPSGFSPCEDVVLCTCKMTRVLHVDQKAATVSVEPGVQIQNLLAHLKQFKLTLHNLPSVEGMTMGGLISTSSHGTGLRLPPLNEAVLELKLLTRKGEELTLTEEDGERFHNAKCSLGTFGFIYQIKLKVVPFYYLKEEMKVLDYSTVKANHLDTMARYPHVKYHYIPYSDKVIVYTHTEISEAECRDIMSAKASETPKYSGREQRMKLMEMYSREVLGKKECDEEFLSRHEVLSFTELRGLISAKDALNPELIRHLNLAELDFFEKSQGVQAGVSYELLMFDCGGRQHVKEFAFEVKHDYQDMEFMEELKEMIVKNKIAAHAPLEQRWTSGSRSLVSPVYKAGDAASAKFCWVGIIMYLNKDPAMDASITAKFEDYYVLLIEDFLIKYELHEHLGKIKLTRRNKATLDRRLDRLEPILNRFNQLRKEFDETDAFYTFEVASMLEKKEVE